LGGDLSDPFEDVKFSAFVQVLAAHGFSLHRQGAGSHAIYRGVVSGEVRLVVVAAHRLSDEIKPGTLASMIRPSAAAWMASSLRSFAVTIPRESRTL